MNQQMTIQQSDTPSFDKQEQSNRNEPPTSENRITTQSKNTDLALTQKQKINLKNLKKIVKKKRLPYHH